MYRKFQCEQCGVQVEAKWRHKKFCEDCIRLRRNEYVKSRYVPKISRRILIKDNPNQVLLHKIKNSACTRDLDFNLTLADIDIPEVCPILGTPFEPNTRYSVSVDRINNDKGYLRGNIQFISRKANTMKNDATPEELVKFAHWVLETYK